MHAHANPDDVRCSQRCCCMGPRPGWRAKVTVHYVCGNIVAGNKRWQARSSCCGVNTGYCVARRARRSGGPGGGRAEGQRAGGGRAAGGRAGGQVSGSTRRPGPVRPGPQARRAPVPSPSPQPQSSPRPTPAASFRTSHQTRASKSAFKPY